MVQQLENDVLPATEQRPSDPKNFCDLCVTYPKNFCDLGVTYPQIFCDLI